VGRRLNLKPVLHNEVVCQVGTLLTLLDGTLGKTAGAGAAGGGGDAGAGAAMERVFLFCLVWSLGGLLDSRDRAAFDAELRTQTHLLPKKARASPVAQRALRSMPACSPALTCRQSGSMRSFAWIMAAPSTAVLPWPTRSRGAGPGRGGRHGLRVPGHGGPRRLAALAGARALLEVPARAGMHACLPDALLRLAAACMRSRHGCSPHVTRKQPAAAQHFVDT